MSEKPVNPEKWPILEKGSRCIEVSESLYQKRNLFLDDVIDEENISFLIKKIKVLNEINHDPISLYINSPGGSVYQGFALIDLIERNEAPIITFASGAVASMATLVAMTGKERYCYSNTVFMLHDMFSGMSDYSAKMKARIDFLDKYFGQIKKHIKKYTKLTDQEIEASRSGELWLFADEALEKGLVDKIL